MKNKYNTHKWQGFRMSPYGKKGWNYASNDSDCVVTLNKTSVRMKIKQYLKYLTQMIAR